MNSIRSNSPPPAMTRRQFLDRATTASAFAGLGLAAASPSLLAADRPRKYRAALIGHTGAGNFGHGHELTFNGRENIEVVAVADPDAAGRVKAAAAAKALRSYADFREMLAKEKPDLVVVAPRWTDHRHAMVMAALRAGAHVYSEKPFAQTLAEADEMLAFADNAGLKIAVALQYRLGPSVPHLKQRLNGGLIGDLLEIRIHGKQDTRAGGEDMVVLCTHQFDLARFFAGDPLWCSARVLQNGHDITLADAHPATEGIGPIAGDEIEALFACPHGVNVYYTSRAKNQQTAGPWGMEFIGSKGRTRLLYDAWPRTFVLRSGALDTAGQTLEWRPLENDPTANPPASERNMTVGNRRVVDDWLAAIEQNREPVCSGRAAMKTLELIHAVFAAGLSRGRVALPLVNRQHPLRAA